MQKHSILLYIAFSVAILGWWGWAFYDSAPATMSALPSATAHESKQGLISQLSLLERETLKRALTGDYVLMTKLIADWDVDAQFLQAHGLKSAKRLLPSDFLRSQLLGRRLCQQPATAKKRKFLPQSYAAASFLLALVDPDQIVALPNGLRQQAQIYPDSLTSQIPLDVDRYNAEKLFLAHPDIAFVSCYYSHPAAIQALHNQGIQIHATRSLATLADIKETLTEIGSVVDRGQEAELLNIFIEASLQTIENRLIALNPNRPHAPLAAKVLYLSYHDQFYLPSTDTVSCELLRRLGIDARAGNTSVALERERIVNINPDCLIISSNHAEALQRQIQADPALKNVSALLNHHVYFVDDDIQQTPTHYIVLAYYDLAQALARANLP